MVYCVCMDKLQETRQQIIDAAAERFRRFGYNKTTMAEIAADCDMSAANIYRFFGGKKDIIAELVQACFRQTEDALRVIVRQTGITASEKLEAFVLEMLDCTEDLCGQEPMVNEAVEFITRERYDLVQQHKEVKQSLIAEILAEGNRSGEFDAEDIVATAELILKSTVLFHYPVFLTVITKEEMVRYAQGIVRLLIRGLGKR